MPGNRPDTAGVNLTIAKNAAESMSERLELRAASRVASATQEWRHISALGHSGNNNEIGPWKVWKPRQLRARSCTDLVSNQAQRGDFVKFSLKKLRRRLFKQKRSAKSAHAIRDYRRLVRAKLKEHPNDRQLALAQCIGSPTMEVFVNHGDIQASVLRHHGLRDGMAIYDLGCGCGRTAQGLMRSGWTGNYTGHDIVQELVDEIARACPGYNASVNTELCVLAPENSLDMLFHWSVFTHLYPEECYVYLIDIFRALKPGGKLVFSFLELEEPFHQSIFDGNVRHVQLDIQQVHLNQFLHRDWLRLFAQRIGFAPPEFVNGLDDTQHAAFGQALAVMVKPI
jgi:SAM-dependent methyltransferase